MMNRSAIFLIVCLCVLIAAPSAFAGEAKKAPETKAAGNAAHGLWPPVWLSLAGNTAAAAWAIRGARW